MLARLLPPCLRDPIQWTVARQLQQREQQPYGAQAEQCRPSVTNIVINNHTTHMCALLLTDRSVAAGKAVLRLSGGTTKRKLCLLFLGLGLVQYHIELRCV